MPNFKYPNNYDDDFINAFKKVLDYLNSMGYTYEESLQKAHDILDEAQRTNNMNESVQQQINTLIVESGTSDAEVLQARVDAGGNEYQVLKERLDARDLDIIQRGANVKSFGAVGDQKTNDIAAFKSAAVLNRKIRVPSGSFLMEDDTFFIPADTTIEGDGYSSDLYLKNANANPIRISNDNVTLRNLRIRGQTSGGILIRDGARNIVIDNCHFEDINQVIWLYECENVTVFNCTFDGTGYGIIQQNGFASNHVKILNNRVEGARQDFVECNSMIGVSDNWLIKGNTFLGTATYDDVNDKSQEKRFIGVTSVKHMIVTGNFIKNAGGDGAIHCEFKTGKLIISDNFFIDCKANFENTGWIYLMGNTPEITHITNNMFIKNDELYPKSSAVDVSSSAQQNRIHFSGNTVVANNGVKFRGLFMRYHDNLQCTNNHFLNLGVGVIMTRTNKSNISQNKFENCDVAIGKEEETGSGNTGNDNQVKDNVFIGNRIDLNIIGNINGTSNNKRWSIAGNVFDGIITLSTISNYNTKNEDVLFVNNTLSENATLSDNYIDRYVKDNNLKHGVGLI